MSRAMHGGPSVHLPAAASAADSSHSWQRQTDRTDEMRRTAGTASDVSLSVHRFI